MTVPEERKSDNIRKSITKFVKANFEDVNSALMAGKVNYRDKTFDESELDYWVTISFISDGAGRKDITMVQFDVYSRMRGRQTGGDRYGVRVDTIVDLLQAAFHVVPIPIYDFSSGSAVLVQWKKLIVKNSDGTFREPEDDRSFDPEDDVARRALTYVLSTIGDASQANQYYD